MAVPHELVPDEPPATVAGGSRVSAIARSMSARVDLERVGRDLGQHGPGARADVDRPDRDLRSDRRRATCTRALVARLLHGRVRRGGDAGADPPVPLERSRAARPGRAAQPKRSAPRRRQSSSRRSLNGLPGLGVEVGLVALAQHDRVEAARDRELVHRHLVGEHARHLARRPHPRRHRDVEPGEPVAGAAVRGGVHHPGRATRSARRTHCITDVCSCTACSIARQSPVGAGAEPDVRDGRGAVAGEGEHLLPGDREPDGSPVRGPRGERRRHHVGVRLALAAEPATDVRAPGRAPGPGSRPSIGASVWTTPWTPWVESNIDSTSRPSSLLPPGGRRVRLERVVVLVGRAVGLLDDHVGRGRARRPRRPRRCRSPCRG